MCRCADVQMCRCANEIADYTDWYGRLRGLKRTRIVMIVMIIINLKNHKDLCSLVLLLTTDHSPLTMYRRSSHFRPLSSLLVSFGRTIK